MALLSVAIRKLPVVSQSSPINRGDEAGSGA